MTESKIKPALTAEEARRRTFEGVCISADWHGSSIEIFDIGEGTKVSLFGAPAALSDAPRLIAALNDLLPDSDSRKITRETIATMLEAADSLPLVEEDSGNIEEHYLRAALYAIADALESYLPPPGRLVPMSSASPPTSGRIIQRRIVLVDVARGVAVLRDGTILTTPDRVTWTLRNQAAPASFDGKYFCVERDGEKFYSRDGNEPWTPLPPVDG